MDFKLEISEADIMAYGIPDVEAEEILDKLQNLVITGKIPNIRDVLLAYLDHHLFQ